VRLLDGEFEGGDFSPERIRLEPEPEPEEGAELSREGIIRAFASLSDWQLGGLSVDASAAQINGDESTLAPAARYRPSIRPIKVSSCLGPGCFCRKPR